MTDAIHDPQVWCFGSRDHLLTATLKDDMGRGTSPTSDRPALHEFTPLSKSTNSLIPFPYQSHTVKVP